MVEMMTAALADERQAEMEEGNDPKPTITTTIIIISKCIAVPFI
jgi:hypothetical protein